MTATAPIPVVTDFVSEPLALPAAHTHAGGVGERQRRRQERQRTVRQQFLVVVVLTVVFGITVAMLAMEWLNSGTQHASAPIGQIVERALT